MLRDIHVAVKALETGIVPPVPNFREPDPELGRLNLSRGGAYPVTYALRLAAGLGHRDVLADQILFGALENGGTVTIGVADKRLTFTYESRSTRTVTGSAQ